LSNKNTQLVCPDKPWLSGNLNIYGELLSLG
jgi:hypothetical protein